MKVSVISENEWVYPDISEYCSLGSMITLHAPRGGYAAAQLRVPGTRPGDRIRVSWDGTLPFECFRMLDVTVDLNTSDGWPHTLEPGTPKPDWCTRQAPFPVFDILQPMEEGGDIVEKETSAFYVCWKILPDTAPGGYEGTLRLSIGADSAAVPVRVTVHRVTLPEKGRLSITNWYRIYNIRLFYGPEDYSDEWFAMFGKLLALMRRTRQTHLLIPLQAVTVREVAPGRYRFDFANIEKMIRLALKMGFSTLELGHLCSRNYAVPEPYWLFYSPGGRKIYTNTQEGYTFLAQFLPCWVSFLKRNGWYDVSVQHVGDEPNEGKMDEFRIICGIVRKFMPGMKLFDAVLHTELEGSVDSWVLQNWKYQQMREVYEHYRELGDEIWQYTCCSPGGKWLNRLLDGELLKPRLLHWGNYRFDLPGYLHWGFNCYEGGMEHLRKKSCAMSHDDVHCWPAGDTHITYPGNANGPWMSLRAERMRAGAEDCELLWMIAERDRSAADALCREVFSSFNEYTSDVNAFDANYVKLLECADRLCTDAS